MIKAKLFWVFFIALHSCIPTMAQPLSPQVVSIPMRDGKNLAADVYLPSGCSQCPVILIQTPYNRTLYRWSLPLGVGVNLAASNYAFVIVDWRGFWGSAAAAVAQPKRGEDGYDVIEWITQQSWSDGKVGTWGPSALGKIQYETAREQHPAHICAVPQVAHATFAYTDYYYGGVLEESYLEQLDALGYGLGTTVKANQVRNSVWAFAESSSTYPAQIHIPMLMQAGWYDHNVDQMIKLFNQLQAQSPAAADIYLLIGPWVHGGTGTANVGSANQGELSYPAAAGWSDAMAMQFFDHHLRGENNGWPMPEKIKYFQLGEDVWKDSPTWPPAGFSSHTLYLNESGTLTGQIPSASTVADQITGDPRNPSPTIGGATLHPTLNQGPYDQVAQVESRGDVLVYSTQPFGQDVVLSGAVKVHFKFISDRKDTDLAVRLTDVYPDGRSMLITDGIHRARFRNGFAAADTSTLVPGQTYSMTVTLPHTAYTFQQGHRLRIVVSTAHSRRWDVNLNNGGAMLVAGDSLVVTNQILRGAGQYSYIELPVVDLIGSAPEAEFQSIQIWPNPAIDRFIVDGVLNDDLLQIFDAAGRLVVTMQVSLGMNEISPNLAPGMYFCRLQGQNCRAEKLWISR
jgi:uncharacterized protein